MRKSQSSSCLNVRTRDVMSQVQAEVNEYYASPLADRLKHQPEGVTFGKTTIILARKAGFCYGVRRAVDMAHAVCRVFPERRKFLIGEMIHNPLVNQTLNEKGIMSLPWRELDQQYECLTQDDIVIVPAFGVPLRFMRKLEQKKVTIVDTTCGDVMKVWRRVQSNAKMRVTSIIHGKISHEETQATISRAKGEDGMAQYLVLLDREEARFLADFMVNGGSKSELMRRFEGAHSEGFNPRVHLKELGMANQTTMYRKDTEEIQKILLQAVKERDGDGENFHIYDTICNATQYRQDALETLVGKELDVLFVVGGFNSSNTTHLVEKGLKHVPTFFIRDADSIASFEKILHFDLSIGAEVESRFHSLVNGELDVRVGITAGASCPNNLLEQVVKRVLQLREEDFSMAGS